MKFVEIKKDELVDVENLHRISLFQTDGDDMLWRLRLTYRRFLDEEEDFFFSSYEEGRKALDKLIAHLNES